MRILSRCKQETERLLLFAKWLPETPSVERKVLAAELLDAEYSQLEVTALKFKIVFEKDLVQAREAGTLSQECFDFVWWL